MAWLQGWEQRYKITIDRTKIDSVLTHFPVTVIIDSSGTDFWSVMTSNNYRKKVAFTKDDKETQLYAECELFDATNKIAIYHVSGSDWTIYSDTDTTFYLYFDPNQSDNTTYIGDTGESPAQNVWDSNFKAVWHLKDVYDSKGTYNLANYNGATFVTGKIGNAVNVVRSSGQYLYYNGSVLGTVSSYTIEAWFNPATDAGADQTRGIIGERGADGSQNRILLYCQADASANEFLIFVQDDNSGGFSYIDHAIDLTPGVWYHIAGVWDGSQIKLYLNGEEVGTPQNITSLKAPSYPTVIGVYYQGLPTTYGFDGKIDESRFSSIARSSAWIKATYHSTNNTLISSWSYEVPLSRATFYSFNLAVSDILKKTSTPFDIKKYLIKPTNLIFDFLGPKEMAKIKAITKSIKTKFRVKKR